MDIGDASMEELLLALEKKKVEYLSYPVKYWRVFVNGKMEKSEIVIGKDEEEAISNIKRFEEEDREHYQALMLDPATINTLIADAKAKWEELESLKTQFKKKNDL